MAPTISSALSEFVGSLSAIGLNLVHSVMAIFNAILALFFDVFGAVAQLGQSILKLGLDLFGSVLGFVTANFFLLLVLGGGYYVYTTRQGASGRRVKSK
ncbi:hypothetical protein C8J56DRAFT_818368 [Mycena floridula]|nr:hypothetical protein C8J56DRAFT_818368 [Mycena floridula]